MLHPVDSQIATEFLKLAVFVFNFNVKLSKLKRKEAGYYLPIVPP